MNFFEDQRRAKKETNRLVFYFFLLVVTISGATGYLISYSLFKLTTRTTGDVRNVDQLVANIDVTIPAVYFSLFVFGLILLVSIIKIFRLKSNPNLVCYSLGAKKIKPEDNDIKVKQYRNIVEEMSIASGTPVPQIFVLESSGINAFVTGFDITNSSICVTRGALKHLKRDELQAVVGHEFSHVLNGDVKLNIKLMGMIGGLVALSEIGSYLMRARGGHRSSRRSKDEGGILIIGLILMVLGGLGSLMASFLKSLISHQREFLADASSVQFTRNPSGITGALKKIYAHSDQGLVHQPKAQTMSHMFLVKGVASSFNFSTHPDLFDRIKAVDKHFRKDRFLQNDLPKLQEEMVEELITAQAGKEKKKGLDFSDPEAIMKYLTPMFMFMQQLPKESQKLDGVMKELIRNELDVIKNLSIEERLKALQILSGQIGNLAEAARFKIYEELKEIIKEDGKIDFNEFIVFAYLRMSLKPKKQSFRDNRVLSFNKNAARLLTFIYYITKNCSDELLESTQAILKFELQDKKELGYLKLLTVLDELKFSHITRKEHLVRAMIHMVKHDGKINDKEKTVVHLVSQCLGVPASLVG